MDSVTGAEAAAAAAIAIAEVKNPQRVFGHRVALENAPAADGRL
jgi:hypothetical protein